MTAFAEGVIVVAVGVQKLEVHPLERTARHIAENRLVPGRRQVLVSVGPFALPRVVRRIDRGRPHVDVGQVAVAVPAGALRVDRAGDRRFDDDVPPGAGGELADGRLAALAPAAAGLAGGAAGAALVVAVARTADIAVAAAIAVRRPAPVRPAAAATTAVRLPGLSSAAIGAGLLIAGGAAAGGQDEESGEGAGGAWRRIQQSPCRRPACDSRRIRGAQLLCGGSARRTADRATEVARTGEAPAAVNLSASILPHLRVERVAQAVAEEVEGEDRHAHDDARADQHPRVDRDAPAPSETSVPHEARGAWTPRPRKDRNASVSITPGHRWRWRRR